ncbi:histone-lysine N-methyltransferase SETMAR-like [Dermacentor silvarum]|uniref:histone-lysine N-methyltransferase SETMAR-like n=1 Tax=Dermacentor silvarum TaxID=543639 RepID=UPI0018988C6C|nr:histone-lysine N-methyltransferase SETMAR-like [Dermacentor silvarum]
MIEEQRGIIRFVTAEDVKAATIHHRMVTVYREDCVSDKSVRKWRARFRAGRASLVDDPRPGQANTVVTADLIEKLDDLVRSDRRVTLRMLAVKFDVSIGTVWTIVYDRLRYQKVCAQWVLKQLTDQHKELRMGLALQYLFRYHEDPAFPEWIITGEESWCHHYEPATKRDSMQRKHASSPPPKKCKAVASAGKVLLTIFFDVQGPLLEFLKHRTINSDLYCETLQSLRRSIKNKRPGLLTEGVVLLHDNVRPQVSRVTHAELAKFKWKQLEHPPYSPDMSPCNFCVVGPLKKHLKGMCFNSDDELKDAVKD